MMQSSERSRPTAKYKADRTFPRRRKTRRFCRLGLSISASTDISDEDLPAMVDGTVLGNSDDPRSRLFPDGSKTPGPSVRSGGEILVADDIEYLLGYPRRA
jgi:hypothetical protein